MPVERAETPESFLGQIEATPVPVSESAPVEVEFLGQVVEVGARKTSLYPEGPARHP